ncbi:MAG: hypothetical protein JWL58_4891 [Streptosporangiaceae bacterium]|nr:hypothetical protein [Streptosporangiaceae bacterium]
MFWQRMNEQFGEAYAASVAKDYVIAELGGRTIEQALADGDSAKSVWAAVCVTFASPVKLGGPRRPDPAAPASSRLRHRIGTVRFRSRRRR